MKIAVPSLCMCALAVVIAAPVCPAAEGVHSYVGTNKCKPCHLKEFKAWSETRMAKSFELLKPGAAPTAKTKAKLDPNKDYTGDANCLACHTTGYGKPGGFVDMTSTPDRAGVGCEVCHGPGGTYTQKEHMSLQNKEYKRAALVAVGLTAEITKDQCIGCHNTKSAAGTVIGTRHFFKDFNFEERMKKGTHERFPLKYKH